ncbi:hypothetical protein [Streptomyces sp. NPDC001530]|uniref:hypothetical protein n=1 Tax=Streptomyces sp. NPDC001530 TaxID=3364582 RepID=UPI0036B8C3FD
MAEEAEELAAGTLDPDCACMAGLFPEALLTATDAVLDTFEDELPTLAEADAVQVLGAVERVVLALNAVDEAHERESRGKQASPKRSHLGRSHRSAPETAASDRSFPS